MNQQIGSYEQAKLKNKEAIFTQAASIAINRYFSDCQQRIPAFVQEHFALPGAIRTNSSAFGWDILRAPLNLLWAPLFALLSIITWMISQLPAGQWARLAMQHIPAGFQTSVQRRTVELIQNAILGDSTYSTKETEQHAPHQLQHYFIEAKHHVAQHNELFDESHSHNDICAQRLQQDLEENIDAAAVQYQVTRTAAADIGNSLSCTALGAFAFQKFTPGGIGIAVLLASWLSKQHAIQSFFLGETLGRWYYALLPPSPTPLYLALSILASLAALSVIAALSGILLDPIQAKLGIHERRLRKMLTTLEDDTLANLKGGFKPKDQYIARILDTLDAAKSTLA